MKIIMKKKILLISLIAIVAAGFLAGCGKNKNNQDGSNADPNNNVTESANDGIIDENVTESVGHLKETVSDMGDGLKDAATDAASKVQEWATDAATKVQEGATKAGEAIKDIIE